MSGPVSDPQPRAPFISEETYDALSAQWVELRDSTEEGYLPNIEVLAEMFKDVGLRIVKLGRPRANWTGSLPQPFVIVEEL